MIASNSGRNAYPVELALYAKEHGAKLLPLPVLLIQAVRYRERTAKKKLMELADVVIDNCGVTGDACLDVEGIETKMMPTSSIANAFIVQTLSVLCAQDLLAKGVEVPVLKA